MPIGAIPKIDGVIPAVGGVYGPPAVGGVYGPYVVGGGSHSHTELAVRTK